jgi:anhydro-N-acetylmuramic acid kinase
VIAEVTGITTVDDFRSADLRAGGEGAPLAPLLHRALFASADERRAVLNLGGIANLTLLDGEALAGGFDTGPANCLMDAWARRHLGAPWDEDGAWAASGAVDGPLLKRLLDEPYFRRSGPRSTGLEAFNGSWLERRLGGGAPEPADVQRTLAELTVETVAGALERAGGADRVLVCGGGVHNGFLLGRLAERLAPAPVESTARHGADPDWIEASLFAWLARERLENRTVDTRAVTGASEPVLLGEVHHA